MRYDHSNLVKCYHDEARRSLENRCFFATISMCWVAVERAVEHELYGGARVNEDGEAIGTAVEFDPARIEYKIEKLLRQFPSLIHYQKRLLGLYEMRNNYCHARLSAIGEAEVQNWPSGQLSNARLITLNEGRKSNATQRTLGVKFVVENRKSPPQSEQTRYLREASMKEIDLIGSVANVANECYQLTERFLDALKDEVDRRD